MKLRIDKLVAGGAGLARTESGVVLVEQVAAGDLVEVEVTQTRPGYRRARLSRLVEPGPGRREPPCPHAGVCGGCDWQHLTYDAQLDAKRAILLESFRRIGRLEPPEPRLFRSPEWGYRRRVRLHARRSPDGRRQLGLSERRSRRIVEIGPCPVFTPALERSLPALRARLAEAGGGRRLDVLDTDQGVATGAGVLATGADGEAGFTPASSLSIGVGDDRLEVAPAAFFQANQPLLPTLVARVVELACRGEELAGAGAAACDLYAGVGLFAVPLARRFERLAAVEQAPDSARLLARNLAAAARAEVVAGDVRDAVHRPPVASLPRPVVVVDPPREGLDGRTRHGLLALRPRALVYVSCDPASMARDVGRLGDGGYTIRSLDLFDMFPQTHHVEAVARLEPDAGYAALL